MSDRSQGTSHPDEVSRLASYVGDSSPESVWKLLAPLLAARRSMRLAAPGAGGKFAAPRTLTARLPDFPAAVPLYDAHGRARLLALDFDSKSHGAAQVNADVAQVIEWLHDCGARTVTDRSTSGGRHVLVPLAADTPLRVEQISPLLALLETRLPTFDKAPMLGTTHGCISVPGSLCREGGHRQLDGSLSDAVDAFTLRSDRGVIAHMIALLGGAGSTHSRPRTRVAGAEASLAYEGRLIGAGDARRLHPHYCRTTAAPTVVATFARTGHIDSARWPTPSEARQSVISHAVLRGASAADIEALLATDDHAGLRQAYERYGSARNIGLALRRDVDKALTWAASVGSQFRDLTHKYKHTGGYGGIDLLRDDPIRHRWLATANTWIDHEFTGSRQRPILRAVVQALAYSSALAGELVEGVPVVAVGGRSLSHAAGLMSESTVWAALRLLRDTPGSPVLRIALAAGQLPDRYALTTPSTGRDPNEVALARAHVAPVHQAWSLLGLRARGLYELIHSGQVSTVKDALAAARMGSSVGYAALTDLRVAGLITMDKSKLAVTDLSLDDVADDAGLGIVVADRVLRHRAERLLWHTWLDCRFGPPPPDPGPGPQNRAPAPALAAVDAIDSEAIWVATLATGPPPLDPLVEAFDLLGDVLGARVLSVSS